MKELKIKTKFKIGNIVYATKQSKIESTCNVCNGDKTLNYISSNKVNVKLRCPECNGQGKITSTNTTNVVCGEPLKVSAIKISVNSNHETSINYRLSGRMTNRLNRAEKNIFTTKEEAQARCDELNTTYKLLDVEDIVIQDRFKERAPSTDKIINKLSYYNDNNRFDKDIVVDENNVLQDGYINYLLCGILNIIGIRVIVKQ